MKVTISWTYILSLIVIFIAFFLLSCSPPEPKVEFRHYKLKVECQGITDRVLYKMSCNKSVCFVWYQDEGGRRVNIPFKICMTTVIEEYEYMGGK